MEPTRLSFCCQECVLTGNAYYYHRASFVVSDAEELPRGESSENVGERNGKRNCF